MPTVTAISPSLHSRKTWRPAQSLSFVARDVLIVLGHSELPRALLHFPIAFIRQGDQISVTALVGITPGRNLMIGSDGKWLGGYLPFQMRSFPFALAPNADGELVLCIVETDGNVIDGPGGNMFFDSAGQLDPLVKQTMEALATFEREKATCRRCAAQLDSMGVLQPWRLTVPTPEGPKNVDGLLSVDEAALNALDDSAFLELRKTGALTLAYCQMLSMQNIDKLVQLAQTPAASKAFATPSMELDFSRMGG